MPLPGRIFSVVCILAIAGLLTSGCSSVIESPQIHVKAIDVSSVTLSNLTIEVTFSVYNPNPVGITLSSLSFDVYSGYDDNWVYLSRGEKSDIEIAPGYTEVTIPVVVDNYQLLASIARSFSSGEIRLQVRGLASTEVLGIAIDVPFTHSSTTPVKTPWR